MVQPTVEEDDIKKQLNGLSINIGIVMRSQVVHTYMICWCLEMIYVVQGTVKDIQHIVHAREENENTKL